VRPADLQAAFALIERFVTQREPRLMTQALKLVAPARAKGKAEPSHMVAALTEAMSTYMPSAAALRTPLAELLATLPAPTAEVTAAAKPPEPEPEPAAAAKPAEGAEADKSKPAADAPPAKPEKKPPAKLPEHEVLMGLLGLLLLLDTGKAAAAMPWALQLMERVAALKRRTLDPIAERVYFYASWAFETGGQFAAIRSPLLAAHRTACLHHNTICQATLLNALLRNLLHYKLFDQAEKLLTKTTFPEQSSNTQLARYLYYTGRIKALQLEYTEAHRCLLQAQRKAPSSRGLGFRLTVHKLGAIVQLLLGEIPDRAIFRDPAARAPMLPYLKLVQAVRLGDLAAFRLAMESHASTFTNDANYTLIVRLRQNVIRAGLRNISIAYSRIALTDVASKLGLDQV
jgi:26S proteasome regulatory subunit N3